MKEKCPTLIMGWIGGWLSDSRSFARFRKILGSRPSHAELGAPSVNVSHAELGAPL